MYTRPRARQPQQPKVAQDVRNRIHSLTGRSDTENSSQVDQVQQFGLSGQLHEHTLGRRGAT